MATFLASLFFGKVSGVKFAMSTMRDVPNPHTSYPDRPQPFPNLLLQRMAFEEHLNSPVAAPSSPPENNANSLLLTMPWQGVQIVVAALIGWPLQSPAGLRLPACHPPGVVCITYQLDFGLVVKLPVAAVNHCAHAARR